MHALSLLAVASTALAAPLGQSALDSESISFNDCEIVLDHDIDTSVVGIQFTIKPAGAVCAASNFTFPSPVFNCGDSAYSFSVDKTAGYYSRYTVWISHETESGGALQGELSFGTNGPIPWLHDQIGTATGTLTAA
ncbi:hypothetical protein F5144DRAFT_647447 [Chaetomium tenue]|uniref:Uncharacterized protein n=1 Tax=Chaetomium tenue TaxID=1854479 RepID=A0ACB7PEI6_9PEZI|nr:hypothetical protein F5144DRAFT_647447 [Chaetomium globosum]